MSEIITLKGDRTEDLATVAPARNLQVDTVEPTPKSCMEDAKVILSLSFVDFAAACLFTYGCVMFIPSNMADPSKYIMGLNVFALGIAVYIVLMTILCREVSRTVGARSMEFAELSTSMLALVLFALGLVLFYPAHALPRWIEVIRRPFMVLCGSIAPESITHMPGSGTKDPGPQGFALTAALFFLLGSLLFCVAPMLHMINMSNENLKARVRDVINQLIKGIAGVLFAAGSLFFIPGLGCNNDAMAFGGYLFIFASVCFITTAVSDMIVAAIAVIQPPQTDYTAMPQRLRA